MKYRAKRIGFRHYLYRGYEIQGFCYDFCKLKDYDNKEDQTTNGRRCK